MIRETAFSIALAIAPFQCGSGSDPPHEETAGDALWSLSQDFDAKGDHEAAKRTLEYLVERYPSSRHADDAKRKLADSSLDGG